MPLETQRPQYRQLADLLREAIERGEYAAGSTLPPEAELAARYSIAKSNVNTAIKILRAEGLVRVERGKGTVVREIPEIRRSAVTRYERSAREREGAKGAFDSEIRAMGMTPRSETEIERVTPPAAVAKALGIPAEIAEDTALAEIDSGPGGIISRFADLGYEQVRITETVRVRRATEDERTFLRLEEDQPVIEIWHTGWTADDRAVEIAIHAMPAYLWVLDYAWPIA